MFLLGEAGIGKSRLAQVATSHAEQHGLIVLRGRAVPTSTPVAYRPLAEAFSSAVRAGEVPDAPELAPFRAALGRLVPDWRDAASREVGDSVLVLAEGCAASPPDHRIRPGDPPRARGSALGRRRDARHRRVPGRQRGRRARALRRDRPRRRALRWPRPRPRPARPTRLDARSNCTASMPATSPACSIPASAAEVASPELIGLATRADGVPFLIEELLAVAVASGALVRDGTSWTLSRNVDHVVPLTFADSVRRRLPATGLRRARRARSRSHPRTQVRLGAPARRGGGRRGDGRGRAPGCGGHPARAVDPVDGAVRFRHALSREAVLAEMLPPERARLSERALDAIERSHPGLPGAWCELAAEVAEGAGDRPSGRGAPPGGWTASARRRCPTTAEATLDRARVLRQRTTRRSSTSRSASPRARRSRASATAPSTWASRCSAGSGPT